MVELVFRTIPLQQDIIRVMAEGRGIATGFTKELLYYINLILFFVFVISILVTISSNGDGNDKNKKVGNWLWMLGFATIGLFILRKLFLNF